MYENPNCTLAETCDKNCNVGSLLFKRKTTCSFTDNFDFAQLSLCVPCSNALIGTCWACAVFGVCTDAIFQEMKAHGSFFLDMLPIFSSTLLKTRKPVTFRMYFIQSEKPTVSFRLESDFLLSFPLCQTKYVAQRPKKPPPRCAKLENFGSRKQMVDCQPSNKYSQHMMFFLWRTEKNILQFLLVTLLIWSTSMCVTLVKVTLVY